jgi:DNA-binding response OmpR family regulator
VPKIMVVEDEELIRVMVSRILRIEGHEVVDFPDAAPALEEADLNAIELILTDLNMPTPGEQLIHEVRKRGAKTPIVVMSGHLNEEKLLLLQELGAQAVLEKPFDMPTLLQAVQTHASSRQTSLPDSRAQGTEGLKTITKKEAAGSRNNADQEAVDVL